MIGSLSLLLTDHPEQANDLFENLASWDLRTQRVFLTATHVFPALDYHHVMAVLNLSPDLAVAEYLQATNVLGLLLPGWDGDFGELILFDPAHWPMFQQVLIHECETDGIDFLLVDEPTFKHLTFKRFQNPEVGGVKNG